jgi:hypothetical protein
LWEAYGVAKDRMRGQEVKKYPLTPAFGGISDLILSPEGRGNKTSSPFIPPLRETERGLGGEVKL